MTAAAIDDASWDAHVARCPEGTFYHSRAWARILAAAFPGLRDESRWIDISGERTAMPLFAWRRLGGLLTTVQSVFPFLYGGPVPRRTGDRDLLAEQLDELARGGRSLLVVGNPFAPGPASYCPSIRVTEDATHLLRLPSHFEEYWDSVLTTAKRNDVRRLAKKGVAVRLADAENAAREVTAVYGFYRASFRRWGRAPGFVYPRALYHSMLRLGAGAVRLYLAEHAGRVVGGAIVVRWNRHVHYHAGYFDHDARALRPNVLIQERIVRDAIEDGFRDYDFLPSGGNPGVETFKEGFGGIRTRLPRYEYRAPLHRAAALLRRH